jgi:hypothetical protein
VFALDRNGHGYVWNVQVFFSGGAGMSGSDVPGEKRWAPWDQNGTYSTLFSDKNAQVWSVVGNALSMAR